jgi:hypothetical protein
MLREAWGRGDATLALAGSDNLILSLDREQIVQAMLALLHKDVETVPAVDAIPTVWLSGATRADHSIFQIGDDGSGIDIAHRASILSAILYDQGWRQRCRTGRCAPDRLKPWG